MSGPEPAGGSVRGDALDASELTGSWRNADRAPRAIVALTTRLERGAVRAGILGADRDRPADWGELVTRHLFTQGPTSPVLAGWLGDLDLGFARLRLQVQLKLGVAVVGSFVTLSGSERPATGFVREFLGRLPPGAESGLPEPPAEGWPPPRDGGGLAQALVQPDATARSLVAGDWRATAPSPGRFTALTIHTASDGARLELFETGIGETGNGEAGNGEAREVAAELAGCLEEDGIPSVCLRARYRRPDAEVELQIRQNKGILAVTFFVSNDAPGSGLDHVGRELFYRERSPEAGR